MIDKSLASEVLSEALSTGGDFAEIFLQESKSNMISMVNSVVEKAVSGITRGCGIRVFCHKGAIYGYTNDLSRESLLKVAKGISQAIKKESYIKVLDFVNYDYENAHKISVYPNEVNKSEIVGLLRQASESSFAVSPLITQTAESYSDGVSDILIINSHGLWVSDRRVRTRINVTAIASSESEKQTGYFAPGAQMGFEFFNTVDMKDLGKKSAESAVTMLKADLCPSGEMPVIIDNGFGGVIFHEACGHSLEATSVAKGASEFSGKLGQQIASPLVTAVDDGTIPNAWGSINIDDEGNKTQKNVLIENGILKSYLVDRLNGLTMGLKATGSSRRESYKFAPTSRMTNTYIAAGNQKPEDIIKSTEYGLYAKKMGGGSVQPSTGEFNFAVMESYIIRNGKINEPVRGASLIGKGSQVLMDIDAVGDNLFLEQGVCGSVSGSVPTCVGQPMIRVSKILVGGRK